MGELRLKGLPDYSRDKASIRRHKYAQKTAFNSSQGSLLSEESIEVGSPMTLQEFRENLSREHDNTEMITFQLRVSRKRLRDGSAHSATMKAKQNVTKDADGNYVSKTETEPSTPGRSSSNRSTRSASRNESLVGLSAEESSAYGYSPSPRKPQNRPSEVENTSICIHCPSPVLADLTDPSNSERTFSETMSLGSAPRREARSSVSRRRGPTEASNDHDGLRAHSYHGQTIKKIPIIDMDSSSSESMFFAHNSDTSVSLASSNNSIRARLLSKSAHARTNHLTSIGMIPAHLQASSQSISETGSDPRTPSSSYRGDSSTTQPSQSPSQSEDSLESFARKFSRFAKQPAIDVIPEPEPNESDSTIDFNESFSSFASFATDEAPGLLDGSDESDVEDEEVLSIGDRSPDSVVVDLTSVSTSLNSKSLSTQSSSRASKISREKSNIPPFNNVETGRSRRDGKRSSRSRHETSDARSVESALSKASNHSTGSWLSRHSKKSQTSRFSRLEEYLSKDSSVRNPNEGSKDSNSKFSGELSTTSSITMGTFQTNQTRDSPGLKKLTEVADSEEIPGSSSGSDAREASFNHFDSNPFLAAARKKNSSVQDTTYDSPRKTSVSSAKYPTISSPLKVFEEDAPLSSVKQILPTPLSPMKTPTHNPGKLSAEQLGLFTSPTKSASDVTRLARQKQSHHRNEDPASPVNRGINLFNPSTISPCSKTTRNKAKTTSRTQDQNLPSTIKSETIPAYATETSVVTKGSKVQDYLRKMRDQKSKKQENDLASKGGLTTQRKSPRFANKGKWNGVIKAVVPKSSPWLSKGKVAVKKTNEKNSDHSGSTSAYAPSESSSSVSSRSQRKSGGKKSTSSRPTIGQFLERERKKAAPPPPEHDEEASFQEPVPSPWRPSTQGGRVRTRLGGDDGSVASSVASSKYSVASSRRTGSALSIFQPHRNADASDHVDQNHVASKPMSLIEQRKRAFESNADVKKQHNRAHPLNLPNVSNCSSTLRDQSSLLMDNAYENNDDSMVSLYNLPPPSETYDGRVSSWHTDALLRGE